MMSHNNYAFYNKRQSRKFIKELARIGVEYTVRKKEKRPVCGPLADFYKVMGIDGVKYEVECILTDEQNRKIGEAYDVIMGSE